MSTYHKSWHHHSIGIFQLVLWVVLCLVFLLEMVTMVWVLVPPTLPTKKLIVVLMVMILFCQGVGIIHTWFIDTKIGPIIHQILWGRIIVVILEMVGVVSFHRPLNSTSINFLHILVGKDKSLLILVLLRKKWTNWIQRTLEQYQVKVKKKIHEETDEIKEFGLCVQCELIKCTRCCWCHYGR